MPTVIASQPYPLPAKPFSSLTPCAYPPEELTRIASRPTATPWPTFTPPPSPTFGPNPTAYIYPTLIPTIDPTQVPGLLSNAFRVEDVSGVNGHALQRVTGWEYGLRSTGYCEDGPYRWLDEAHVMVLPVVGEESEIYYYQALCVNMG